jgi:hypothetical protein
MKDFLKLQISILLHQNDVKRIKKTHHVDAPLMINYLKRTIIENLLIHGKIKTIFSSPISTPAFH